MSNRIGAPGVAEDAPANERQQRLLELFAQQGQLNASQRREAKRSARDDLRNALIDAELQDDRNRLAEDYLPVFLEDMNRMLASLNRATCLKESTTSSGDRWKADGRQGIQS